MLQFAGYLVLYVDTIIRCIVVYTTYLYYITFCRSFEVLFCCCEKFCSYFFHTRLKIKRFLWNISCEFIFQIWGLYNVILCNKNYYVIDEKSMLSDLEIVICHE